MTLEADPAPHRPRVLSTAQIRTLDLLSAANPGIDINRVREEMVAAFTLPLSRLREIERTVWHHFSLTKYPVGETKKHIRLIATSWLAVTFRQAHAAFLLAELGFDDAANANVRTAFEHAIFCPSFPKNPFRMRSLNG
jgi:hypothetical protein